MNLDTVDDGLHRGFPERDLSCLQLLPYEIAEHLNLLGRDSSRRLRAGALDDGHQAN